MKPLNFLNPNNNQIPKNNNFIDLIINIFFITIILIILTIQAKQLWTFFTLKKEYKDIKLFVDNQKDIIKNNQELNKKYKNLKNKVESINNPQNRPDIIIKKIAQIIPENCYLKEFIYSDKKIITLTGLSKSTHDLANFLKQLSKDTSLPKFNLNYTKKDLINGLFLFEIKSIIL